MTETTSFYHLTGHSRIIDLILIDKNQLNDMTQTIANQTLRIKELEEQLNKDDEKVLKLSDEDDGVSEITDDDDDDLKKLIGTYSRCDCEYGEILEELGHIISVPKLTDYNKYQFCMEVKTSKGLMVQFCTIPEDSDCIYKYYPLSKDWMEHVHGGGLEIDKVTKIVTR